MQPSSEPLYCLQDTRAHLGTHVTVWNKDGGYTTNLDRADLFTWDKALAQHLSRSSDVPVPIAYLRARSRPVVDTQLLRHADRMHRSPAPLYYAQLSPPRFDGNDLLFLSMAGEPTSNLNDARLMSGESEVPVSVVLWPSEYIKEKSRPAADVRLLDIKEALGEELFSQLKWPVAVIKKPVPNQCPSCGLFLRRGAHYETDCRRCNP